MINLPRTLLVLLASFFTLSSNGFSADEDYLPLREGDEWTMDVTMVSPEGKVNKATARRRIGNQVTRDGKTYQRTRTSLEGGPVPFDYTKLTRKDETGFYGIAETEKNATEQLEVKFPLKVGQHWERSHGEMALKDSIIALETVTIGDKTYENCFRIRSRSSDGAYLEEYWEAPHVGSVKSEITYSNGARFTLTLREFKPGKP